jgi:hypothetical protein
VLTALVEYTAEADFATLGNLAAMVLRGTGTDSTSTIRNQLRRLARAGLFTKVGPGCYQATRTAMDMVRSNAKVVA